MDTNVDIDGRINWEQFYTPYVKQGKKSGDNIIGLCPFHQDSNPSFSVSLTNGLYKCFACGEEGNPTTFLEKIEGINSKEAYKKLLEMAGYDTESTPRKSDKIMPYTLDDYAADKGFTVEFLQKLKIKNVKLGIAIPYMDTEGKFVRNRIRYGHNHTMRFSWGKGGDLCLYGLWKLDKIRATKEVVLVEGESDTQTLWVLGKPTMGVPGAATFKRDWCKYLEGIERVYLHKEPDQGGETFIGKMLEKLKEGDYKGEVYVFSLPSYKDPSDMYTKIKDKEKVRELIDMQLKAATKVNLSQVIESVIECSPVKLKQLNNYRIDDSGVYMFNAQAQEWRHICRTPLVLSKRIRNIETDEEKVELAYKRDGRWHYIIEKRSIVFQSRNLVGLADVGITVTSENAKFLVRYLQELEAVNFDILNKCECVTQLGWHDDRFLPYGDDNLIVDVESNAKMWVNGYKTKGELNDWINFVSRHRESSPIIRAYIAAACATPFLRPLGQRIFYLYNWSDTEGGKTACLNLALSVWGDPTKLMQTYNSTSVGLEFMASYMNDLPLGLNERQAAGKDQAKLETDAYRLAEGKGRLRGNKKGGLQSRGEWRSIILANGEEPFITPSTMSGVSTRTIELYGKPFAQDADAKSVYEFIGGNYGTIGKDIVSRYLGKDKLHDIVKMLKQLNKIIDDALRQAHSTKKSSNISAVAFISAIDVFLSANYFNPDEDQNVLLKRTLDMATFILNQVESKSETDIVEKFYNDTQDWMSINKNRFIFEKNIPSNEIYGLIERSGVRGVFYYVYPKVFEDFCNKEGQSYKKMLQGFGERGYIQTLMDGDKLRTQVRKSINGKQGRVIQFYFEGDFEPPEEDEKMPF
ncbi:hypothetical protein CS063_01425 [Sporanaerobium hydrogeniformans]|uniref:Uncharacterized protein n=1 Tax=Sporanaerobium hydrogeniformans TaxID=3072179 RepID=A0AC61DHB3_9FIRM|nr:DUF927 domain-containing protein [Sporanaerobium hydrogeniformans]PHV72163.1 hypothetical protein CS063_01425 [Sporanaerobium hydrogeniformans]